MGDRTLEAKLTARLLAVVAPALVAVGVASVALTWWALDSADADVARARTGSALAAMHSELTEPDPFPKAAREVLGAVNEVGGSLIVVDRQHEHRYDSRRAVPPELAATPAGTCAKYVDADGERWRACAARDDQVEVVAAIDVTPHAKVVRTVAEGVALEILLALLAAAFVAHRGLVDAMLRARATSENIAHELRTPLTAMRAELEALASGGAADGVPTALGGLRGDVDRLSRVVDAILVLAAPPGRSRAADCVVNLADVARELAPPGTKVEAPDEALVMAEPRLVELAITNLLENARKHAGREAHTIRVMRAGAVARIAVIDDGPGLADDARARMFDRYWRASGDGGGTGLGLALVRAVAQRHGGDADARAVVGGSGLEVEISFANVVGWHEGELAPTVTRAGSPRPAP